MIVIWSGWGILWPLFWFGGFFLGHVIATILPESFQVVVPIWCGALGGLLCSSTVCRPSIDSDGYKIQPNTLFFGPVGGFTLLAIVISIWLTVSMVSGKSSKVGSWLRSSGSSGSFTLPTPMRTWKDDSGRTMVASLQSIDVKHSPPIIKILRKDGEEFSMPFNQLDEKGEEYVKNCWKKMSGNIEP